MRIHGATGTMTLMSETDDAHERETRGLRLEASVDGRTVVLTDIDCRKPGILRIVRYEITAAELIAAIRARGTELLVESRSREP
ncbi:putative chromosome partitioning protein, ATP-binding subunit (plasmid) [Paraburkholderia fungorum]|uniref:Chromosome partitioning protein, ATP-binding subunit n=2 Tax=Paraburkholderia fungorum TaxID=134537 RepID=A0AAU8SYD9_9BURK|nr:hypothetical protein [Paraburkholderia fungorum]AJZ56484.1 putative chromosome partitioning protein, ATP-binding subunit [Paraburkholderia fungorum]MDE1011183.1 hypothetical protein [Paraburkholderia fungorum]PNE59504.1 hypothetical protein A8H39_04105 [Paraburkholderia fungorum]PZR46084.1 MAG: hypothetical protein DI523_18665 [Paraburkholderia fungorum]QLD54308.1 hypothetical protein C9419_35440 [Paraburkholderia fungorum]